jgi:mannan endo-1,4-beta-mannosidase
MPAPRRTWIAVAAASVAVVAAVVAVVVIRANAGPGPEFLTRSGDRLMLNGRPFAAAGSNNYRPMFLDESGVDEIMRIAAENHFQILRVWAFNDIGLPDGTDSVDIQNLTTYFQYWDGSAPARNEGGNGLLKLDYVVASAKRHGIRLVLPFVNNWNPFGGMDQYVTWAGGQYHSEFYTDPRIRQWYRDWVSYLLERTNVHTGVKYKDEPAIAMWELANEARCHAAGTFPAAPDCSTGTLTGWAREMAAHVKSIDRNHLVGFGDEGFMCDEGADHWAYDCSTGVDARAIAAIEDIDVVGLHLYPDHWDTDVAWSSEYIRRHLELAGEVGKPVFLGEYGWRGAAPRNTVFHEWLSVFQDGGGDIALYWIMQPRGSGITPPDSDGFTAYCPSPVCTQVGYRSRAALTGRTDFPPVPDTDVLLLDFGQRGTLDLLANDVSPFATLDPDSVDLDAAAPGQQTELSLPGGDLGVAGGVVSYTPESSFSGPVSFDYTVADDAGRVSAPTAATIRVAAPAGNPA